MKDHASHSFEPINTGFNTVFQHDKLSIGVVVPLAHYPDSPIPDMQGQLERIKHVERLGFGAVWLRDVPFNVPSFGDAGQIFDPFVYLGLLAGQTSRIALGVSSIILPLRHPAHVAKAAASVDVLSGGRLILGVASGDRPEEYPALNMTFPDRGARFREGFEYIRQMSQSYPAFENAHGTSYGNMDMLPKPTGGKLPLMITGGSQQSPEWGAKHADGWMTYPRPLAAQAQVINQWNNRVANSGDIPKPVMQHFYIDLDDNVHTPQPIHLGLRLGVYHLVDYLTSAQTIGINHIALNLRFNRANIDETLERLAAEVLPAFA